MFSRRTKLTVSNAVTTSSVTESAICSASSPERMRNPPRSLATAALPDLSVLFDIGGGNAPRREQRNEHSRKRGHHERECQYATIERDVFGTRQVDRRGANENCQRCRGDPHAKRTAGRRQHQLFEDGPEHQPCAPCTECGSNCRVSHAPHRARQRQIREVRAGNQQNGNHRCQEHDQSLP